MFLPRSIMAVSVIPARLRTGYIYIYTYNQIVPTFRLNVRELLSEGSEHK